MTEKQIDRHWEKFHECTNLMRYGETKEEREGAKERRGRIEEALKRAGEWEEENHCRTHHDGIHRYISGLCICGEDIRSR
jgi:hypothetical protein